MQKTFSTVNCPEASVSSVPRDLEVVAEYVVDPLGAFDVTGGAVADADQVPPYGAMSELE